MELTSYLTKTVKKYVITAKGNNTGYTIYVMGKEVWLSFYACANTPYNTFKQD